MDQPGSKQVAWAGEVELLEIDGDSDKLIALVEQRYAISREEAQKQVTCFLKFHHGEHRHPHQAAAA